MKLTFHSIAILLLSIFLSPIASAKEPWKICAIYPHLKDSYWLSVNYGMVKEAKQNNIELTVYESGGYPNVNRQKEQIKQCVTIGANAIILGTVDPVAFQSDLKKLTKNIPVFASVNELVSSLPPHPPLHLGEVGVDWYNMGFKAGEFLAKQHPKGSGITYIGWLPGPKTRGGTKPVTQGFNDAIKDSDIIISATYWGDNSKELQRNLIQDALENEKLDYLVGGAVAIEVAISELASRKWQNKVGLVSTYLSHAVYRGLLRERVLFSPTDQMVLQGRLSIQQAIDYLNHHPLPFKISPTIETLTPDHLPKNILQDSLSPAEYRPTFFVAAQD
ncbi:TMAO reductase system periplasmic protein TorT [Aliivibrio sp. S4TY2]|uniref:TMAO reductase system periplasmic protein TorT n=1 Tax=unclassified Aliivibrio TaxID=2645654 RepID=UPI00237810B2|nr:MULTISPECIES: TMAO reductase system periplasmic protein TorT [unclassified Aliivibrio]MDD9155396.1 TMAO reductase system periplasmic protein TorT [Aliivibrio sp. S4TY2]MDD9161523.1 TMAO reductase system periplasmic protein TorT [Aliivibrio sp. S4TY1]MDD9165553.1 TMAO reductase system periplasmic protein TorT [Aliivibrio sp. S4MY2]MDD9169552.1 TMAO reductase system periplasmic protein TorT [Aliivibrio sp. S4MY4]MDD9186545.1 TMAO reductase system periplasmic protein TorT [Aliivibrio sp. S4MY3